MVRVLSTLLLLFFLIGIAAPMVSAAEDACSTQQNSDASFLSNGAQTPENKGSESHGPCDCPLHHQSCCQVQFFVGPQFIWQGWNAEQRRIFSIYPFLLASPILEGPFQPPKA